jgi:hypothetical protein
MADFANFDTQRLTHVHLQLVAGQERRRGVAIAVLAIAVVLAVVVIRMANGQPGISLKLLDIRSDRAQLKQDLERARLELQMERATRAELERQIQVLGEQVIELNQQLEFVNSRTTRQSAALRLTIPATRGTKG